MTRRKPDPPAVRSAPPARRDDRTINEGDDVATAGPSQNGIHSSLETQETDRRGNRYVHGTSMIVSLLKSSVTVPLGATVPHLEGSAVTMVQLRSPTMLRRTAELMSPPAKQGIRRMIAAASWTVPVVTTPNHRSPPAKTPM
jgi:hypothetical protein